MEPREPKRVELLLPIRTVLIVAAAIGILFAFKAIGSIFLIVFLGIFLGLVFEFPVRFVMRKTNMSRGLAATITVLGTAIGVVILGLLFLVPMVGSRPGLPARTAADGRRSCAIPTSWPGSGTPGSGATSRRARTRPL